MRASTIRGAAAGELVPGRGCCSFGVPLSSVSRQLSQVRVNRFGNCFAIGSPRSWHVENHPSPPLLASLQEHLSVLVLELLFRCDRPGPFTPDLTEARDHDRGRERCRAALQTRLLLSCDHDCGFEHSNATVRMVQQRCDGCGVRDTNNVGRSKGGKDRRWKPRKLKVSAQPTLADLEPIGHPLLIAFVVSLDSACIVGRTLIVR